MRSPLCLIKMFSKDGSFWRVFFSAATARGVRPLMIVYLRTPTEAEKEIVEEHVFAREGIFLLDHLIQDYLFDLPVVPPVLVADLMDQLDGLDEEILSDKPLDSGE